MPDQTGNTGFYDVNLLTVENQIAKDEEVQIRFFAATSPGRDLVNGRHLTFPPSHKFEIPAFPQGANLVAEVNAPRFRMRRSGIFTLADGETKTSDLVLFRAPSKWSASFVSWERLPEEFRRLTRVLEKSRGLKIINGISYDFFVGEAYDSVSTSRDVLAKASLLNLFLKLSMTIDPVGRERPWFSFIQQIIEIGRERILAVAEPEMGSVVRKIKDSIGEFKDYKNTPAGNHHGNIPAGYRVKKSEMFSVKTQEKLGNLQLTLSPAIAPDGSSVLILDADIDENGELLKHLADLFKHKFSGGTHPFDIHEYLVLAHPREPLGYVLV